MSELDLIPAEYRLWTWQLRWLRRWAWMLGSILVLTLSAHLLLSHSTRRIRLEVQALEARKNISLQQKQEIERLRTERDAVQKQLNLLEAIRRSDSTLRALLAVDQAIGGKSVWFQQWQYEKASASSGAEEPSPRMTLKGQAIDHAALSQFIAALLSEPAIEDAQITRSALRRYVATSVVDFEAVVNLGKPSAEGN
jgi:hypothetical protein